MIDLIKTPEAGGVSTFQGITRNNFNLKKVKTLHYEAYDSMALKELQKLADHAISQFNLLGIYLCHRLGEVVR